MKPYRLGLDLGGTKMEVIVIDPDHAVRHRKRTPTPGGNSYDKILTAVHGVIGDTLKLIPEDADTTIGIGIPGSINPDTEKVQNANATCLIGNPFQRDIQQLLGRRVAMENDANCFTLAETHQGAGKDQGHRLVFGVIMGTGCGGGICVDGSVYTGSHGIAGEWGHISVDPGGTPCYCGNRGCVETKISGSGVENAYYQEFEKRISMEEIVAGARTKDPGCMRIFEQFLDDFGRCLGGLISILDPDAVILGGGLSNIDELYTTGIRHVRRYAFHGGIATPILKNTLGDSAGVFGAAWVGV